MKDNFIPIILIHKGNSPYLPASLLQLRHVCPHNQIYLIGNEANRMYDKIVEHVSFVNYSVRAIEFINHYIHFSTNGYEFELICLQRWFVLEEFMKARGIQQCVYLDSDILVYSDLNTLHSLLSFSKMTITGISPHHNFIHRRECLTEICDFIWKAYTQPNAVKELEEKFEKYLKKHGVGGISDMTFFTEFKKLHPEKIADLSIIHEDAIFDITLDTIDEFEDQGGFKKIEWQGQVPYGIQRHTGNKVKFHTLHFQGKCKGQIYNYVTYGNTEKIQQWKFLVQFYMNKVLKKFLSLIS